ncbi:MAG: hypothetical protein O6922_06035 [Chloroflexi bacterium]|nr:hypothetical protein [Chloroflexota bacterium]
MCGGPCCTANFRTPPRSSPTGGRTEIGDATAVGEANGVAVGPGVEVGVGVRTETAVFVGIAGDSVSLADIDVGLVVVLEH